MVIIGLFYQEKTWFIQLIFHYYWIILFDHQGGYIYLFFILLFIGDLNLLHNIFILCSLLTRIMHLLLSLYHFFLINFEDDELRLYLPSPFFNSCEIESILSRLGWREWLHLLSQVQFLLIFLLRIWVFIQIQWKYSLNGNVYCWYLEFFKKYFDHFLFVLCWIHIGFSEEDGTLGRRYFQ